MQSFKKSVTVQYVFLWASGGPPRAAQTLATPLLFSLSDPLDALRRPPEYPKNKKNPLKKV